MRYTAIARVVLPAGVVLGLSEAQAAVRAHALAAGAAKGTYQTIAPVEFKMGETFGSETELPKSVAEAVDVVVKRKAIQVPES